MNTHSCQKKVWEKSGMQFPFRVSVIQELNQLLFAAPVVYLSSYMEESYSVFLPSYFVLLSM
jgi:hypothetical protein